LVEPVGAQFGRDLEPNGLNLEGLAVVGGVLYAGLRAPSLDGSAYIVSTDVEPLFTPGTPLEPRVIPLALGRDTGIRDLAPLPDGRILVLAGPARRTNRTLISPCSRWISERAALPASPRSTIRKGFARRDRGRSPASPKLFCRSASTRTGSGC